MILINCVLSYLLPPSLDAGLVNLKALLARTASQDLFKQKMF